MSDRSSVGREVQGEPEHEADLEQIAIGEVLALLQDDFPDISISKIRFLESRGLIEPHRAPSGYRRFSTADLERLRWILTMQRDHFLPLRVIRERLAEGERVEEPETEHDPNHVAAVPRPRPSRFRAPTPGGDDVDVRDLARLAGLSAQQVEQLLSFGIIESYDDGSGARFTREEVRVAKAAAAFLQHGIEARHLKAWRVAAEREAGMLEQIVIPIARKGSPAAEGRAREVAEDLIDMGNVIRETIIVKSLRQRLGFGAD